MSTYTIFICVYLSCLYTRAPVRSFTVKRPPIPWLSTKLRGRIKHRNAIFKHVKRANSLLGYTLYRHICSELNVDIKRAKSQFQFNLLNSIHDPNIMWEELAHLGLMKTNLSSPLQFFSAEVDHQLKSYYASVVDSALACSYDDFISAMLSITEALPVFSLGNVSSSDLLDTISLSSSTSFSSGPDGISFFCIVSLVFSQFL